MVRHGDGAIEQYDESVGQRDDSRGTMMAQYSKIMGKMDF